MSEELPYLHSDEQPFPDPGTALTEPNGLLAYGGQLNESRLIEAYSKGIFPWFNSDDSHMLWWSPDPRAVLFPAELHVSKSLGKLLRQKKYRVTFDTDFQQVISQCANLRANTGGTWITDVMQNAYESLHVSGIAHSIEVWNSKGVLAGGMYGVSLGRMFFGESMFRLESNTSKIAVHALIQRLIQWDFTCLDCQMMSPHLESIGTREISRTLFITLLEQSNKYTSIIGPWSITPLESGE